MIEKKKGQQYIHTLRLIEILEADFNSALKHFSAKDLTKAAETNDTDTLADEQWGLQKNRTSTDAEMLKLLTFEYARIKKSTIGEESYECKACVDRVLYSQSNIYAAKQNFADNLLITRATCVEWMTRHVKTGAGVSSVSYQNKEGQPQLTRELLGKADVPALLCQQRSVLLRAHNEIAPGLLLASCTRKRNITHNNISYSDDNDSHVSAPYDHEDPIGCVVSGLKDSGTKWNNLIQITGGALVLHTICWRIIPWRCEERRRGF